MMPCGPVLKPVVARAGLIASLASLLSIAFMASPVARAAQENGGQDRGPQQAQQGRGGRGPAIDPAEDAAIKAFNAAGSDSAAQIKAGQDFESKFPNSRYAEPVQSTLAVLYYNVGDYPNFYTEAEKVLAKDPDSVPMLTLEGWIIPRDYKADDPAQPAKLDKAEQYEKHALDLIARMQKPARLSDDQFNQAKAAAASQAHSGLGMTYFRKNDFENSATELESAGTTSADMDPADLYILGVDYQKLQKNAEAAAAYSKCAQIQGALQDRCKQSAEALTGKSLMPQ